MTKKAIRLMVKITAGLIATMIVLGSFGIWRLSSGPISLSYLTTTIEERLNSEQDMLVVDIKDTTLTWGGWSRAVDIVARDVFISQKNGVMLTHFPEVSIGLSMRALIQGVIAPTSLALEAPEINVTKYEDGHLGFDLNPADDHLGLEMQSSFFTAYETLMQKPGAGGVLGHLTQISIENAKLTYQNRIKNAVWYASGAFLTFERTKEQFTSNLKAEVAFEDDVVGLSVEAVHQYGDDRTYLLTNLEGLPAHMILQMAPKLEGFIGADNAISGNLELALDEKAQIRNADFLISSDHGKMIGKLDLDATGTDVNLDLQLSEFDFSALVKDVKVPATLKALEAKINGTIKASGKITGEIDSFDMSVAMENGKINLANFYQEKLNIKSANFEIVAADNFNQLDITKGRIDVGEGILTLKGQSLVKGDERSIKLVANLVDFQMQNLHKYWPQSMGSDAWNWIVPNVSKGDISKADINIFGRLSTDGRYKFTMDDMGGKIISHNVEVDYFAPMSIATGGVVRSEFGLDWIKLYIDEGFVDNLSLNSGYVEITNSGETDNLLVDLDMSGPIDEILINLDREPLMFLDDLGFDRDGITGEADVKLNLALELSHDLTADQIKVRADANIHNLYVPNAYGEYSAHAEKLSLIVDNDGMDMVGDVRLAESLLAINWRENFDETSKTKSRFLIAGDLDKRGLKHFGFELDDFTDGNFKLDLTLDELRNGTKWIETSIDLAQASVFVPALNWKKEIGEYGDLSLKAEIKKDGDVAITPFSLMSDGLILDGAMNFADHGNRFVDFTANRLEMGENSLKGRLFQDEQGRFSVRAAGPRFDVSGLINMNDEKTSEEPDDIAINIMAEFDTLTNGTDSQLNDVRFDLVYDDQALQTFHLTSKVGTAPFTISHDPARFGGYDIDIRSTDAGAVLAQLDMSDRVDGGAMVITGRREIAGGPVNGVISIKEFELLDMPLITKILEFMSLTGIISALGQAEVSFTSLEAEFNYFDGVLDITRGLAFGTSIGITTEGKIDMDNEEYALKGTVAPIYSLSRVISWIPLLGPLLSGEGGIFAARYTVGGSMDEPDVFVNPISTLTPGILRNIFDVFGGDEALTRDQKKSKPPIPESENTQEPIEPRQGKS